MHLSKSYPASRLITGSAALLGCGAASAPLKLLQEARAGEQRRGTTGSQLICRQRLSANAECAEPCMYWCSPVGAAAPLDQHRCSNSPASKARRPTIRQQHTSSLWVDPSARSATAHCCPCGEGCTAICKAYAGSSPQQARRCGATLCDGRSHNGPQSSGYRKKSARCELSHQAESYHSIEAVLS